MIRSRRLLAGVLLAGVLLAGLVLASAAVRAQSWPTGPVHFVVGYAPGGTSDVSARVVGEALSQALGQPVLVENRPGAQGGIAMDTVARARPDGYTLLVSPAEAIYQRAMDEKAAGIDIDKTLVPVTILTSQPLVVVANPAPGWKTIAEMVAAAKAKPGGLSYATPAVGGTNTIVAEMIFRRAGVKVVNIPYKGGGQAVQDVLSGVVPLGVLGSAPLIPYATSGRLTLLAVTSKERDPTLPAIPAMAELGYPEIDISQWFAVFAPAGTPPEIVARLAGELNKALGDPKTKERLAGAALSAVGGTPEECARRLGSEGKGWLQRAREFGLDRN
jgi:tripartite-type tricarboxylate transporter receptor subunit TctC